MVLVGEERFRFARALAKELWCNQLQVWNLVESRVEQASAETNDVGQACQGRAARCRFSDM